MPTRTPRTEHDDQRLVNRLRTAETLILSDIDGTIFDVTPRWSHTASHDAREQLIGVIEDAPKLSVIHEIQKHVAAGAQLVFLTGRRRSHVTRRQLHPFFQTFRLYRNATQYNPTLSSTVLKTAVLRRLLETRRRHRLNPKKLVFYEDRQDILDALVAVCAAENLSSVVIFDAGVYRLFVTI